MLKKLSQLTAVRLIKSRRLIWAGHVARMEDCRTAFKISKGNPTGLRVFERFPEANIWAQEG